MLNTNKSYDNKRLKKCVLSFLRKLVWEEISLMSDGSAFQARGPAMENARWYIEDKQTELETENK